MYPCLDARIGRGWRLGLDGMRRVMARMPPVSYPVILVGGTNGKGSVCVQLHDWLRNCGHRVGLTTSPHLVDVRERIIVDGLMVSPAEFDDLFAEISNLDDDRSTYFETLALMAIRYFQKRVVDIAVVEIGLGGRLDAFNALDPIVSVITSIGLEHEKYLGDTVEKIAIEKAQIARSGRPCVLGCELPALVGEASRLGGVVEIAPVDGMESFRDRNLEIAVTAAAAFHDARGETFDEEGCRRICASSQWPCRFEVLPGSPEVLLDAAHNPPAAEALALGIKRLLPKKKTIGLTAFVSDKDAPGFFVRLDDAVESWVITEFENDRALPAAQVPAPFNAVVEPEIEKAFRLACESAGAYGRVLVTGSIYFLGEILRRRLVESPAHRRMTS